MTPRILSVFPTMTPDEMLTVFRAMARYVRGHYPTVSTRQFIRDGLYDRIPSTRMNLIRKVATDAISREVSRTEIAIMYARLSEGKDRI